ncbi:MAG: YmdB family metallophosphoesterase, partial [Oscillospiraceae bacterium]|nr:YmdB family metallophosphoesterase [Oscillospiraceae bacterium]
MTVLAVGDVCGEIGIRCIEENLRAVRKEFGADFCVVNGENADVMGIKPAQAWRLYDAGADIVSLGNHIWNRMQIMSELDEAPFLVRPLNLGPYVPGRGVRVTELADGRRVR